MAQDDKELAFFHGEVYILNGGSGLALGGEGQALHTDDFFHAQILSGIYVSKRKMRPAVQTQTRAAPDGRGAGGKGAAGSGYRPAPAASQRADAPHGSGAPEASTGRPSSSASSAPAEFRQQQAAAEVADHAGGKAGGVGVQKIEQRRIRQYAKGEPDKAVELLFQLPDLAARTAPVGGRVHESSAS